MLGLFFFFSKFNVENWIKRWSLILIWKRKMERPDLQMFDGWIGYGGYEYNEKFVFAGHGVFSILEKNVQSWHRRLGTSVLTLVTDNFLIENTMDIFTFVELNVCSTKCRPSQVSASHALYSCRITWLLFHKYCMPKIAFCSVIHHMYCFSWDLVEIFCSTLIQDETAESLRNTRNPSSKGVSSHTAAHTLFLGQVGYHMSTVLLSQSSKQKKKKRRKTCPFFPLFFL